MSELQKNMIDYFVVCINEFASRYSMPVKDATIYLYEHKGLDYLEEFYDIEHTLSFDDTVDNLTLICKNNGGELI